MATRRIVVDGAELRWTRRHGRQNEVRVERLVVWSEAGAQLELAFVDDEGGRVTAGEGWGGFDGGVVLNDDSYNLNRPAVVAALVRAALARGWDPSADGRWSPPAWELLAQSEAPSGSS